MSLERGIVRQLFSRAHQQNILVERNAAIDIGEVGGANSGACDELRSGSAFGDGKIHQPARQAGRDCQFGHGLFRCLLPGIMAPDAWRHGPQRRLRIA
jgi:hypothetical protein